MVFIYTGPSWAERSFEDPGKTIQPTNLAKQWGIECIQRARSGASVFQNANAIDFYYKTNPKHSIVWIYNEPILDIKAITGLSPREFLQRLDWQDLWNECNQACLQRIASIGCPVLLIGAHSDIVDCDHSNITVAHPSWQKWLAEKSGFDVTNNQIHVKISDREKFNIDRCWGAEIVQRYIRNNPDVDLDRDMVMSVWNMLEFWIQMSRTGWFSGCHPTRHATEKFAEFLKPTVTKFLQDNK
jgi:hypothetical protein